MALTVRPDTVTRTSTFALPTGVTHVMLVSLQDSHTQQPVPTDTFVCGVHTAGEGATVPKLAPVMVIVAPDAGPLSGVTRVIDGAMYENDTAFCTDLDRRDERVWISNCGTEGKHTRSQTTSSALPSHRRGWEAAQHAGRCRRR